MFITVKGLYRFKAIFEQGICLSHTSVGFCFEDPCYQDILVWFLLLVVPRPSQRQAMFRTAT